LKKGAMTQKLAWGGPGRKEKQNFDHSLAAGLAAGVPTNEH